MAAAVSMVDVVSNPARVKNVPKERFRAVVGGAGKSFGLSRESEAAHKREAGRLDERERSELLLLWGGHEGALGCRSAQGAIVDRLLRAPPRDGRLIVDAIERELGRHGRGGYARDRLVNLLADEDVATRYEIRRALRGMVGAGVVEFFKAREEREKRRKREATYGMLTGPEQRETLSGQAVSREAPAKAEREVVDVEMARLVARPDRRIPEAVTPAERWRRADEALEASWHVIGCSESSNSGGSRLPPAAAGGYGDAPLRALRRLPAACRRVIERAYASALVPPHAGAWADAGPEVARIAPLTASVERARLELVRRQSTPASRATVDRSIFAADALRAMLDQQPEEALERIRWKAEREAFVTRVRKEAEKMLADAVDAYRKMREGQ